jgi:NTP pyrophosphatase (non-canonical NTP hydrolase)
MEKLRDWPRKGSLIPMSMTFEEFEARVVPMKREPEELGEAGMLLYQSNGMAGEAGEVANEVKKLVRDGDNGGHADEVIKEEVGDTLFYAIRLLKRRGMTLEDAAEALLQKLELNSKRTILVVGPYAGWRTWLDACGEGYGDNVMVFHIQQQDEVQGFCLKRGRDEIIDMTNGDPFYAETLALAKSVLTT